MAEGRMLKKQISQSRRVAELKSDTARLLYTWIIPHLDVEGRMNADPDIIKGLVVPRLSGMTPGVIRECLLDMHSVGIITLYEVDGDFYLEVRKFAEHQNLRKDKESASKIPCLSGTTPAVLPDYSRTTPDEVKLSEVKLREDIIVPPSVATPTTKGFIRPTVSEIREYCKERDNAVDAEKFHSFYESNGWKVGKNAMKDWKAAVRTWDKTSPKKEKFDDKKIDMSDEVKFDD